jgi:site-specific recombinase XerD
LRHSFAKALLDRGAKLPDIAELLGHEALESALVYTRADTEGLREVADNYAAFLPSFGPTMPTSP